MRSVADMSREELEQTLANEIASARSEVRPISRLTLSRLLQSRFLMNPHEAEKFVDAYCDDKAPGVPTYLSSEFGVPYLKVLAIVNSLAGLGLSITALVTMSRGGHYGVWFLSALFFIAAAAICWVQSVRPQREEKGKAMAHHGSMQQANASATDPAAEPVATGSFQPRS
jgi:hypothetical protein